MPENLTCKNNIVLSDYNYKRDIENRLLMSELSVFEVDVLKEVLDSSLRFSAEHLADILRASEKDVVAVLKKLSRSKLVSCHHNIIHVDKEMRRYYEFQMMKFDDEFEPGMEYLQGLLSKLPIQALPGWYSLPNSCESIFASIVENYLHTPKIYERYLQTLQFEDEAMEGIMHDVFAAPDFKANAKTLIQKYELTREQFEEYMLLLEFNFVCCLGYNRVGDRWHEVVTPFYEWRNYLQFEDNTKPKAIQDTATIIRQENYNKKVDPEAALENYRKTIKRYREMLGLEYTERDMREVERSLNRVSKAGWIYFDDFMKGFTAPIGKIGPVVLQKGKRWRYALPEYTEQDQRFIETVIAEGLSRAGMVELGTHNDRFCFCVTSFGRYLIDG